MLIIYFYIIIENQKILQFFLLNKKEDMLRFVIFSFEGEASSPNN